MNTKAVRLVGAAGGKLTPIESAELLKHLVGQVVEYRSIVARERTRQEEIRAQRDVILAEIAARRKLLLDAADQVFREHRETLTEMFGNLECAVEKGDSESVGQVLGGIVALAKHSPLSDVRELAKELSSERFVLNLSAERL